jgi:hypothetical protein
VIDEEGHVLGWFCVCGQTLCAKPDQLIKCCKAKGWVSTELDTEDPYRERTKRARRTSNGDPQGG